jgi:Domain of unknown function (DUF4389)
MATDMPAAEASAAAPYPMQIDIERQPQYDKLRALIRSPGAFILSIVNALVLLPTAICLLVLELASVVVYLISCFAILFTGRFPRGMFNFQLGVLRWAGRVNSWVFLLSDNYPPFSFDEDAHPMRVAIEYPERVSRWRGIPLLTGILAIPVVLVGEVIMIVGALLIYLPPIVPGVIQLCILFTGEYPEGLFNLCRGGVRIYLRGVAYGGMLVTRYPTFDM